METQELDSMKMKTMKEMADANVLLASMKADLKQLNEDKENFFKLRESEVSERITGLLNSSQKLLEEAKLNYGLVHEFYETLKSFSAYLKEGQTQFQEVLLDFKNYSDAAEKDIQRRTEEVEQQRLLLKNERASLEKNKEFNRLQTIKIEKDKAMIKSRQAQIKSALDTLRKKTHGT